MGFDPVILNYEESILRQSDVDALNGPDWLSDSIITFYFEYLEKSTYKDNAKVLFISPEVVQCLKAANKNELSVFLDPLAAKDRKFVFMALNNCEVDKAGGSHWSLLAYSQPEETIYHFDSMSGANFRQAAKLACKLLSYFSPSGTGDFMEADSRQQENSYDCGIFVLCNVDMLAKHCLKSNEILKCGLVEETRAQRMRADVLNLITNLQGAKKLTLTPTRSALVPETSEPMVLNIRVCKGKMCDRDSSAKRSPPRKRLHMDDSEAAKSPDKSTFPTKKLRLERSTVTPETATGSTSGPASFQTKGLSQEQLMNVIETMMAKHSCLEAEAESLKENSFKSLSTSPVTSKIDWHWRSVVEYVLVAWKYIKSTLLWDNAIRKQCFKSLADIAVTALRKCAWTADQLVLLRRKFYHCDPTSSDIQTCLNQIDELLSRMR